MSAKLFQSYRDLDISETMVGRQEVWALNFYAIGKNDYKQMIQHCS